MKVTGKDTFRHTQTSLSVFILSVSSVLSADPSLYFNYYVLPPLHSSTGFSVCVKLQSLTGAIRILTYLNLSLSLTRRHLHILIFYIRQEWSNIQCMKRLIKWGMIDERQNWERGVNWRCLDWVTVLKTLVVSISIYFQKALFSQLMWINNEELGKNENGQGEPYWINSLLVVCKWLINRTTSRWIWFHCYKLSSD